ncbi:hypothetical protein [Actinomadura sp. 9N407]|uniref:hypothetical protein n=1 Tax=Actinomadura sp. 9N407 TaxID=3375154 RepID=UPI0037B0599C
MRMRIVTLGIAGVAAAGMLSGCGGEEEPAAVAPSSAPSSAASSPAAAPVEQDGGGGAPAEATKPGTKLKLGQQAVVPVKSGSVTGTVGITVTKIEPGDKAVFAQRFKDKANGMDPYYIRYTVENKGGSDLSRSASPLLSAVGPGGGSTGAIVIGSVEGCERGRPDKAFAKVGATYETCRLQAARTGIAVSGAEYDETDGGYDDAPIVWSK